VLEVADIFRAAGPKLCARLAVLPSQKRVVQAILKCRTPALGGQVYGCEQCSKLHFSYHSCGNRHCPKCHGQRTEQWLEKQRLRLLPCPYYLLTFTLPSELRALARSEQKLVYGLLLSAAAASIQKLCRDPQWLGAQPALLGVLHTWTRAMLYHPHAHFLVSAGGLSADGQQWVPAKNPKFLVPVRALSRIFRAKVRDGLKAAGKGQQVPAEAWKKEWVVHAQHAGSGQKVLDYLGRYVFRIAITHSRLESLQDDHVTFRYRDNRTQQTMHVRLPVAEFIQRFLQHVLPRGFAKVRHYGLASAAAAQRLSAALALLLATLPPAKKPESQPLSSSQASSQEEQVLRCPHCHTGRLIWLGQILPSRKIPP
jgi:Putative transposase/Transposase zinc-binding domain